MPGYEQARAEIEARGGEVQTAGGGGLFAWLFGARGGGADDAEEGRRRGSHGRGRAAAAAAAEPRIQIADAGPDAVAKAKRNLPTGPAYASAVQPLPLRRPPNRRSPTPGRTRSPRPSATCRPARPTPAPDRADAPGQTGGRGRAGTGRRRERRVSAVAARSGAAQILAPLPPRRPTDLDVAVALADAPCPRRGRPICAVASAAPGRRPAAIEPQARPRRLDRTRCRRSITCGIDGAPTRSARAGGRLARAKLNDDDAARPGRRAQRALAANADPATSTPPAKALRPEGRPRRRPAIAPRRAAERRRCCRRCRPSGALPSVATPFKNDRSWLFGGLPVGAFRVGRARRPKRRRLART